MYDENEGEEENEVYLLLSSGLGQGALGHYFQRIGCLRRHQRAQEAFGKAPLR